MDYKIINEKNILEAMKLLKNVYIETEDGKTLDIKFFNFEAFNEVNFKNKINKDTNIITMKTVLTSKYNQILPKIDVKYCIEQQMKDAPL